MTDEEKLQLLEERISKKNIVSNQRSFIKIDKIQLNNFRFFLDDEEHNSFELDGQNMLLYGENGSGKSSLYKAFELLSKVGKENITQEFKSNKNIFKREDEDSFSFIKFEFTNDTSLQLDDDNTQRNNSDFIKNLSVFKPLLDYKELLKVVDVKEKNLYEFFELLLEDYPVDDNLLLKNLKEKKDKNYFITFEEILKSELHDFINIFLKQFKQNFKLIDISFSAGFKEILLKIEYFDKEIEDYQLFLNEARLSALAISVYFAIIKKQFSLLGNDSLKILVLDDLLISLDMNNRMNLIDMLKTEFNDFQIFFFTHDKALFEIFKDKMSWKAYEIYVDEHEEGFEIPFVKKSNSLIEQAKYQKHQKNYDCSANLLRQYTEKLLCKFLPADKLVNKNCKQLDLNGLLQNAVAFEKSKEEKNKTIISILESLKTYRNTVLNPAAHYDDRNVYKSELHEIILKLTELEHNL